MPGHTLTRERMHQKTFQTPLAGGARTIQSPACSGSMEEKRQMFSWSLWKAGKHLDRNSSFLKCNTVFIMFNVSDSMLGVWDTSVGYIP